MLATSPISSYLTQVNQHPRPLLGPVKPGLLGGGYIERGTPAFLRTIAALFAAGFATFALLYCVQPLMPEFSRDFGLSAFASSLSLSVTTGLLAFSMLAASAVSERYGRKPVMLASILASAMLTLLAALTPRWSELLLARALMGITLSGLPAVAMAYVGEEMHPGSVGLAMGLYIGGSALGGMSGRLVTAVLTDLFGWRAAMFGIGLLGLVASLLFGLVLPPSRHFQRRTLRPVAMLGGFIQPFRDAALPWLFFEAFCLMGSFVTVYNYIGYRLLAPPFTLSQTAVGLLFAVYLIGIFSSAWMGGLADRLGRHRVFWKALAIMLLGAVLTLSQDVAVIVAGVAVLTFGFFGGHSIASAWVGARAPQGKAPAAALYLLFYYLGSSVVGSVGGVAWALGGWPAVVGLATTLLAAALAAGLRLGKVQPLNLAA